MRFGITLIELLVVIAILTSAFASTIFAQTRHHGSAQESNRQPVRRRDFRVTAGDAPLSYQWRFTKFDDVLANPAQYGFTRTDIDVLHDTSLTDKSFIGPGADYVFWDDQHGTSKLHELVTAWHLDALTNSILEKLEATIVSASPTIQMDHLQIGRGYTLQSSIDLTNWLDGSSFTASAGTNQWASTLGNNQTAYFRLKWQR